VELYLDRLAPGRSELAVDTSIPLEGQAARLSGRLSVDNMDQRILVHGSLQVRRTMDCHRCGRPTEQSYAASLEVLILRSPGRGGRQHQPDAPGEEDNWVIHATRGVVDLTQAVREAVFLDEPILIRCGDDCPFEAKEPANAAAADSEPQSTTDIDPRWEKLRRLRQADDDAD
jgi:uncharacterized metal-binding protein YceD (DUF177 family)